MFPMLERVVLAAREESSHHPGTSVRGLSASVHSKTGSSQSCLSTEQLVATLISPPCVRKRTDKGPGQVHSASRGTETNRPSAHSAPDEPEALGGWLLVATA